jgi:hypothetical protein
VKSTPKISLHRELEIAIGNHDTISFFEGNNKFEELF